MQNRERRWNKASDPQLAIARKLVWLDWEKYHFQASICASQHPVFISLIFCYAYFVKLLF